MVCAVMKTRRALMKASDAIRMLLEDQGRTQRSFALKPGITPTGARPEAQVKEHEGWNVV